MSSWGYIVRQFGELLNVKTLITLAVTAVFAVLTLKGQPIPEGAMTIIGMVFAFYFGTQHEKRHQEHGVKGEKNDDMI